MEQAKEGVFEVLQVDQGGIPERGLRGLEGECRPLQTEDEKGGFMPLAPRSPGQRDPSVKACYSESLNLGSVPLSVSSWLHNIDPVIFPLWVSVFQSIKWETTDICKSC